MVAQRGGLLRDGCEHILRRLPCEILTAAGAAERSVINDAEVPADELRELGIGVLLHESAQQLGVVGHGCFSPL